jgi:Bacteriophage tail sheath protein
MIRNFLTPGIYRARTQPAQEVRLVRTDIAGFVGYAERGPVATLGGKPDDPQEFAVRLTSWAEYRKIFGGLTPYAYMPYAVRAFFENGGQTCYVVRVAGSGAGRLSSSARTACFSLPTGISGAQVSALAQTANEGTSAIVVASTNGFQVGMIIGLGDPDILQLGKVTTVKDAQTLSLASALEDDLPAGAPVSILTGTTLVAKVLQGHAEIQVADASLFQAGVTALLCGPGTREVVFIDGMVNATTLRLTSNLKGEYGTGALLVRQTSNLRIAAASPGNWGNRLRVNLIPLRPDDTTQFDLRISVAPGPDVTQPAENEAFLKLSLDKNDPRFARDIINDPDLGSNLIRLEIDDGLQSLPVREGRVLPFPITLSGGRDGLADISAADFVGSDEDFRGLRLLEEISEVSILVAPDTVNVAETQPSRPKPIEDPCAPSQDKSSSGAIPDDPTARPGTLSAVNNTSGAGAVFQAMVEQARRLRYRVALLDTPDGLEPKSVWDWVQKLMLSPAGLPFAGVYYPWIKVPDGLSDEQSTRRVPPGGHVAGVYAQVDNSLGVQHPPANVELAFATGLGKAVSEEQHGYLNEKGVNVIRSFPGRGIRVWGARSLAAQTDAEEWWFIHIRRTLSMIEDSIEKGMKWTVFENNDDNLRRTLRHSLNVMLERIWRAGGLKGASASEAYYVKCDDRNNPQAAVDLGKLVCEIGVAIAAPMEFLVFEVRREAASSEVVEA